MIPVLPILAIGAALWGGKKIYNAVTGGSGGDADSSNYSDNSYEREHEARQAAERSRHEEREERQYQQLQQTLHTELRSLCSEYLSEPVTVNVPSREQIQRFADFEIDQLADAKEALGHLLGANIQLKAQPSAIADQQKQLKALNELEQLVRGL